MRFNGKQVLISGRSGGAKVLYAWMVCAITSMAAIAALPAPAGAQVLYGAGPAPNSDPSAVQPSYLYRIDPATAQVTQIGSIGFANVRSMDADPMTGVIYATAFRPTGGVSGDIVLLTINPTTGQGTEVMSWGISNVGGNSKIAIRPSDGRIFVGWGSSAFAEAELEDLDLTPVPGVSGINSVTFDFAPDDRLWWIYSEGNLFWRNLETGERGPPQDVFTECCVDAMSFHPNSGALWVVTATDDFRENLATLDTTTGAFTEIGTFHPEGGAVNYHLNISALAWSEQSSRPISLWSGEDDADDSIGQNDGVPENGGTWAAGKIGLAFVFDGVDDRIVIPNHESLEPGSQMTIDAWVYLNSFGHGWPIMQKRPSSNVGGYTFETTHNPDGNRQGLDFVILNASGPRRLSTPAGVLQAGVWQHVAATYDGATMRIYVDGVLRAEGPAPAVIDPVNEPVVIGSNVPIPSFTLNGMLDEIRFHRRALNPDEVMAIYESGADPEADDDDDGIFNGNDNCPLVANPDQADADGDGIGDACEPPVDTDADGIPDASDNCPLISNADQLDTDGDGIGNACDVVGDHDADHDGVIDDADNCPLVANPGQQDTDGDGLGNACEPPGTLQFSSATYSATEADTRGMLVTVVRVGGDGGKVSVDFTTADGTAVSAQTFDEKLTKTPDKGPSPPAADYTTASGSLTFADGETEKRFRVFIVDDTLVDPNETILAMLSNPRGGAALGSPAAATITIADNDPNLSFDLSASSGAEGRRNVDIAVTLSAIGSSPITVGYSVTGGTAAAGDYLLPAGTLTFSPSNAKGKGKGTAAPNLTQSIRLQITDDTATEPNETVIVQLANPSGAFLGARSEFTYTILANDQQAPDSGNTPATAQFIDLAERPRREVSDSLSRSDSDMYRVHLDEGEFLALDVDTRQSLSSSEMVILDSDGVTVLATVGRSAEPDTGKFTNNPAYLFTAPHSGDFFILLRTNENFASGYTLELHRVAVATPSQNPAVLDEMGPMFVSLNGDILSVTGPSGYGFSMEADWTRTSIVSQKSGLVTSTYHLTAGFPITLRTALGDVGLGVPTSDITIETRASRFGDVFSEVAGTSIALPVGLPIDDLLMDLLNQFGAEFQVVNLANDWTIRLGATVASDAAFKSAMPGIPYLVYEGRANYNANFGFVVEKKLGLPDSRHEILMVMDPTDPSFGVRLGPGNEDQANFQSFHLSRRGFVPYRPALTPTAPGAIDLAPFYGHVFSRWELPIIGGGGLGGLIEADAITVILQGQQTVDLDADDDGQWLGGLGNAHQLFKGDLASIADVAGDINFGFNGKALVRIGGPIGELALGRASAVYNGDQQGLWFKGQKGIENPWANSPLAALEMNQEDVIEGTIFGDGRFFLSTTSTMNLPGDSELHFTITMSDREVTAEVEGTLKVEGSASFPNVGSASCRASAGARGSLEIGYSSGLDFAGSIRLDGSMRCYVGGTKVASAGFDVSGKISDDGIAFDLPFIGNFQVDWP